MQQFAQVPITITLPFRTFDPRADPKWSKAIHRSSFLATAKGLAPNCHEDSPVVFCTIGLPSQSLSSDLLCDSRKKTIASRGLRIVDSYISELKEINAIPVVECHSSSSSLAVFYFDVSPGSTLACCELVLDFGRTSSGFEAAVLVKLYCAEIGWEVIRSMLLLDKILHGLAKLSGMPKVFDIQP